jgi:hypothetical protein
MKSMPSMLGLRGDHSDKDDQAAHSKCKQSAPSRTGANTDPTRTPPSQVLFFTLLINVAIVFALRPGATNSELIRPCPIDKLGSHSLMFTSVYIWHEITPQAQKCFTTCQDHEIELLISGRVYHQSLAIPVRQCC